jgi:hypothetical protein
MSRLSVNINDETSVAIKTRMEEEGRTATEIVRRAISVYDYVMYHQERGRTIAVLRPSGVLHEQVRIL